MKTPVPQRDLSRSRVLLDLLESVQRDGSGSQRERASEFGVALGLVNAYLNYCVKKGLIRVKKIPAKRYVYYLTPKGFAEKSRLAVCLISDSFRSFRHAREDYGNAFRALHAAGHDRVLLIGLSELAEVSMLCATENGVVIPAILDRTRAGERYIGVPVVGGPEEVPGGYTAAIITDLTDPEASYKAALNLLPASRVIAPAILGIPAAPTREAAE